jgi:hypothetical protein
MLIDKHIKTFMSSGTLTKEETIDLLNTNKLKWEILPNGKIKVLGNFVFPVALNYFPFPEIEEIEGTLVVSSLKIKDDLSVLPKRIGKDLIFSRNQLIAPYNFPKFGKTLDLSSGPKLMDISALNVEVIDGDLILDNCNISNLKNDHIKKIKGSLIVASNRLQSVGITAEIDGVANFSNNFLTHIPTNVNSKEIHVDGNPVMPNDEFEQARW